MSQSNHTLVPPPPPSSQVLCVSKKLQALSPLMDEDDSGLLIDKMIVVVNEISSICDYRNPYRKQLCNLARKIKLLVPMFEEIKDNKGSISDEASEILSPLKAALDSARRLLRFGSDGSKIFLVLEREKMMKMYQEVTAQLEQVLSEISFEKLDVSDEVREQFKRAKDRVDTPDEELFTDILYVYNLTDANSVDSSILQRLVEKLHLTTIPDLKQESLALHELVVSSGGADPGENIEKMSMLLKKIKDFVQTQNPEMGNEKPKSSVTIPDDFRCPISLDLMKDPVMVATGQTYEQSCIEKWIDSGHDACPKTQQKLRLEWRRRCRCWWRLWEQQYRWLAEAQGLGVMGSLVELKANGTDRGKRKAVELIERIDWFLEQQKRARLSCN